MNMKLANARKKAEKVLPYLEDMTSVLDFGCGDLLFARELKNCNTNLAVTGVDVVDFGVRYKGIGFETYNGRSLPYKDRTFDTVIAWHVFHHTQIPFSLLAECFRVSKQYVLFVEPVFRGSWDIPGMKLMDWVFNVWKDRSIDMPYTFSSSKRWQEEIRSLNGVCREVKDVELLPRWLPTGRSLLFVCEKKHAAR